MTFTPQTIQAAYDALSQTYVDLDGDPMRVHPGGDLYPLARSVAILAAQLGGSMFLAQQNARLATTQDLEVARRIVRPFGLDLDPGRTATGGIVAIAQSGAAVRALPLGAVFEIGGLSYLTVEAVQLAPPYALIPVVATDIGNRFDQPAGTSAHLRQGEQFGDYRFVVGTNGLDSLGNPYGDIAGGLNEETLDSLKARFYRKFNSPGFALPDVLYATAMDDPGVVAASVHRHTPAPGYVTVYIDNGSSVVPRAFLERVKAALYQKASPGEYLIVRPMDRELVDLEVEVTIDGSVSTLTAKAAVEQALKTYLYGLEAGQGVYELRLKDPITHLGYTKRAVFRKIVGASTEPFVDIPDRDNVLIRPGLIRVSVRSES